MATKGSQNYLLKGGTNVEPKDLCDQTADRSQERAQGGREAIGPSNAV